MFDGNMKYFASINKQGPNDMSLKGYLLGGLVLAYKQRHIIIEIHFLHPNKKTHYLSGLISIAG